MRLRSLPLQFGLFFLAVTIPLAALLVFQNFHAIRVVHDQVAESESRVLALSLNQLDQALENVEKYLLGVLADDPALPEMNRADKDNNYELARIQLFNRLTAATLAYPFLGGMFAHFPPANDLLLAPNSTQPPIPVENRGAFSRALAEGNPQKRTGWVLRVVDGRSFALVFLTVDGVTLGAWAEVETLLGPLNSQNISGRSLFVSDQGQPFPALPEIAANRLSLTPPEQGLYRISGTPARYLVMGLASHKGQFRLVSLWPEEHLLQALPTLRIINAVVAAAVGLLLLLFFFLLRRVVLGPLGQLTKAMARLKSGDLDTRILGTGKSPEFALVNETFNLMVSQIHDLRIHVYEEQLHAQKAELMFLRLQINPHFFLNSLNILYQLAQIKDFALIKELTLSLSRYFQFMFRSSSHFVGLQDEWDHVKTYIRIQELRFPRSLRVVFNAPEPFPVAQVPPLLIQAFVENSVKYGLKEDAEAELSVELAVPEPGQVVITITDSGPGFPPALLENLNAGRETESQDHIGIANTKRRLELLYPGGYRLTFANREAPQRGATVEITLPTQPS